MIIRDMARIFVRYTPNPIAFGLHLTKRGKGVTRKIHTFDGEPRAWRTVEDFIGSNIIRAAGAALNAGDISRSDFLECYGDTTMQKLVRFIEEYAPDFGLESVGMIPDGEPVHCAGCATRSSFNRGFRYCTSVLFLGDCITETEFKRLRNARTHIDGTDIYYDRRFYERWPERTDPYDVLPKRLHVCKGSYFDSVWAIEDVEAYIDKIEGGVNAR